MQARGSVNAGLHHGRTTRQSEMSEGGSATTMGADGQRLLAPNGGIFFGARPPLGRDAEKGRQTQRLVPVVVVVESPPGLAIPRPLFCWQRWALPASAALAAPWSPAPSLSPFSRFSLSRPSPCIIPFSFVSYVGCTDASQRFAAPAGTRVLVAVASAAPTPPSRRTRHPLLPRAPTRLGQSLLRSRSCPHRSSK